MPLTDFSMMLDSVGGFIVELLLMPVISNIILSDILIFIVPSYRPQLSGVIKIVFTASHEIFFGGCGLMVICRGSEIISLMSAQSMCSAVLY